VDDDDMAPGTNAIGMRGALGREHYLAPESEAQWAQPL